MRNYIYLLILAEDTLQGRKEGRKGGRGGAWGTEKDTQTGRQKSLQLQVWNVSDQELEKTTVKMYCEKSLCMCDKYY